MNTPCTRSWSERSMKKCQRWRGVCVCVFVTDLRCPSRGHSWCYTACAYMLVCVLCLAVDHVCVGACGRACCADGYLSLTSPKISVLWGFTSVKLLISVVVWHHRMNNVSIIWIERLVCMHTRAHTHIHTNTHTHTHILTHSIFIRYSIRQDLSSWCNCTTIDQLNTHCIDWYEIHIICSVWIRVYSWIYGRVFQSDS